jgi:hypothetical protein
VSGLRGVTLTVRFLCELAMLAALAYWGFTVGDGAGAWVLGIGAPLMAAIIWGAWVAPKARWPVPIPDPGGDRAGPVRGGCRGPRSCWAAAGGGRPRRRGARYFAAQRLPGTPGERQITRSVTVVRPTGSALTYQSRATVVELLGAPVI